MHYECTYSCLGIQAANRAPVSSGRGKAAKQAAKQAVAPDILFIDHQIPVDQLAIYNHYPSHGANLNTAIVCVSAAGLSTNFTDHGWTHRISTIAHLTVWVDQPSLQAVMTARVDNVSLNLIAKELFPEMSFMNHQWEKMTVCGIGEGQKPPFRLMRRNNRQAA